MSAADQSREPINAPAPPPTWRMTPAAWRKLYRHLAGVAFVAIPVLIYILGIAAANNQERARQELKDRVIELEDGLRAERAWRMRVETALMRCAEEDRP